jgi:stage II sporulation protein D
MSVPRGTSVMALSGDGQTAAWTVILALPLHRGTSVPIESDHRRSARHPSPILVACVVALLAALLGSLGGGARTALGADPTAAPTPPPAATPSPTAALPLGATAIGPAVTFYGRGYGHGVGMSQYGARGRALTGQDATAILAHYYRGATLGAIATTTRIRVRILSNWTATPTVPLLVYGRLAPWTIDGIDRTFPADAALRLIPTTTTTTAGPQTTWRLRVTSASGTLLYNAAKPASVVVRGAASYSRIQLWSKPTSYDQFRGILRILTSSTTATVTVVNDLPLETYLRGVVPVEMPSTWPGAALKAQAIASRSYAARRLHPRISYYDVPDDSSSQVYRGALGERATTNAIIASSAGVVLRSGTAIANTLFHSTGGGGTENNENVYTSSTGARVAGVVSYLRGSMDRDANGVSYDAAAPYATWATRTYTAAQLSAWFAADPRTNVGTLTALDLRHRGVSGRLISVRLIGTTGTKTVSSDVFRSVFNLGRPVGDPILRSTLFSTAPIP